MVMLVSGEGNRVEKKNLNLVASGEKICLGSHRPLYKAMDPRRVQNFRPQKLSNFGPNIVRIPQPRLIILATKLTYHQSLCSTSEHLLITGSRIDGRNLANQLIWGIYGYLQG